MTVSVTEAFYSISMLLKLDRSSGEITFALALSAAHSFAITRLTARMASFGFEFQRTARLAVDIDEKDRGSLIGGSPSDSPAPP